jgi:hypothetical protein
LSALVLNPKTAEAYAPLWQTKARYKGAWGGRGSGKSNDRAQAVIIAMISQPGTRVVCLREVQNSIRDSVYQLICDWIERLGVGPLFDITRDEIRGPGGSQCIFRGMKDQNADSIKSLEGYRIAWFEEAQTCSQRSLDLLRPTIRAPGSELWFTWNPRKPTDPIDVFLRANKPPDAIVIKANYDANPWFPDELEAERKLDETGEESRYRHIWLGEYEAISDMQLISAVLVQRARQAKPVGHAHDEVILGVDVARYGGDETVLAFRRGRDAYSEPWLYYRNLDTMEVAARVAEAWMRVKPDAVFIDEGGLGAGVVDRLRQLGFNPQAVNFGWKPDGLVDAKVANKRAEMWVRMRDWLRSEVAIPDDEQLEAQLTAVEYKHDANNAILLEKKEDMRKRGLPSPDRADALALTFAYPVMATDATDPGLYDLSNHGRSLTGY